MLSEDVLAVTIDDGLFWLMTGESGEIGEGQISVGDQDLVDDALENGSAVAQGSDEIVVVPPQQWATDRPVTVQTWAERPPSLSADWDDICEASLVVRAGGVFWGTNFNDVVKLP